MIKSGIFFSNKKVLPKIVKAKKTGNTKKLLTPEIKNKNEKKGIKFKNNPVKIMILICEYEFVRCYTYIFC